MDLEWLQVSPLLVKARDAMDKNIITVDENVPAIEAVRTMAKNGVWSVLVTKNEVNMGVMTDRDFIRRCVIPGLDPARTSVGKLASFPLITIGPDESLGTALQVMVQKNVRRLFVVEKGRVVGRVTQTGLMERTLNTFQALASVSQQM